MNTILRAISSRRRQVTGHGGSRRNIILLSSLILVLVMPMLLGACLGSTSSILGSLAWTGSAAPGVVSTDLCCSAAVNLAPAATMFQSSSNVMQVEEDWELVIDEPDPERVSPQIGIVMQPFGDVKDLYFVYELNFRVNPEWGPGGMEIQLWHNGQQSGSSKLGMEVLQYANETVRWTQRLRVRGDDSYRYLCLRVVNGTSQSWGSFGGSEPLHLNYSTSRSHLNSYDPAHSVSNSGITYASHRVRSLKLTAVRAYGADFTTLLWENTDPVVVFSK
jgi:hypothetical protein